jgi:hypothetical protein
MEFLPRNGKGADRFIKSIIYSVFDNGGRTRVDKMPPWPLVSEPSIYGIICE